MRESFVAWLMDMMFQAVKDTSVSVGIGLETRIPLREAPASCVKCKTLELNDLEQCLTVSVSCCFVMLCNITWHGLCFLGLVVVEAAAHSDDLADSTFGSTFGHSSYFLPVPLQKQQARLSCSLFKSMKLQAATCLLAIPSDLNLPRQGGYRDSRHSRSSFRFSPIAFFSRSAILEKRTTD